MAPKKYTTETFSKYVTDSIAKNKEDIPALVKLGELVVTHWQLASFDIPKPAVRQLCDILFEHELLVNINLNTVLVTCYQEI